MKTLHKKRSYKKFIIDNKKDNLKLNRHIYDVIQFQNWFAKMGGLIENEDMEKVIEKFK